MLNLVGHTGTSLGSHLINCTIVGAPVGDNPLGGGGIVRTGCAYLGGDNLLEDRFA